MPRVLPEEYKKLIKAQIIQAAIKIFAQKGYHASTMDEIATKAGMSKTTIYSYFKSKAEILQSISTKTNISELFQQAFKARDYPEALEELYKLMISLQGSYVTFELLALSSHNENIGKINRNAYNEKLELLTNFLKEQQNKGKIRTDLSAKILAQIIAALYTDASTQLVIGINERKIHENWIKAISAVMEK